MRLARRRREGSEAAGPPEAHAASQLPGHAQVVEHQHALIKREFRKRLTVQRDVDTPAKAAALLTSVVNDVVKKASVEADVCSLPATYCAIIEAGGGWPPAKYR